jgi:hypothetical protein
MTSKGRDRPDMAYDSYGKASRDLIIQAEPEGLVQASASCLHISHGSVGAEFVLFAMTVRGAEEHSRTIMVPVGAPFSSPELPLEPGFPSFQFCGLPSKRQLSGLSG